MASTNKRTLVKCLTYRIMSICMTIFIVYTVTGSAEGAFSIGLFDFFVKLGMHFGHERVWKLVKWGKF